MSTRRVDQLNVGLMLGALALAFALPFELFLFSYAVLGPLHYLTEIAWLHQRRYFALRPRDGLWLALLCGVLLLIQFGALPGLDARASVVVNALAVGLAITAAWVTSGVRRLLLVLAAGALGLACAATGPGDDLLRLFLPTLIHVWVFTGAFVLLGALRGRSMTGLLSLAVFVGCSVACFAVTPPVPQAGESVDGTLAGAYRAIADINDALSRWLGMGRLERALDVFFSDHGRRIARFIAFAYTYHYLNWFSKTSVIQWHRIPRAWAVANLVIWIGSVGLYAYDYALGLSALFGLSYLHVYLELPLNSVTFAGIASQLRRRRATA